MAIDTLGFRLLRDVAPAKRCSSTTSASCTAVSAATSPRSIPAFEYVYLARPDSVMDGLGLQYAARHGRVAGRKNQA